MMEEYSFLYVYATGDLPGEPVGGRRGDRGAHGIQQRLRLSCGNWILFIPIING